MDSSMEYDTRRDSNLSFLKIKFYPGKIDNNVNFTEPKLSLQPKNITPTCIRLSNNRDEYIAFNFSGSGATHLNYSISPKYEVLSPHSTRDVLITLLVPPEFTRLDRLWIQTTVVNDDEFFDFHVFKDEPGNTRIIRKFAFWLRYCPVQQTPSAVPKEEKGCVFSTSINPYKDHVSDKFISILIDPKENKNFIAKFIPKIIFAAEDRVAVLNLIYETRAAVQQVDKLREELESLKHQRKENSIASKFYDVANWVLENVGKYAGKSFQVLQVLDDQPDVF